MPKKKGAEIKYTDSDVLKAISHIKDGTLTYRQASQKFGIPISSVCDRIKKRVPLTPCKSGPTTNLTDDQENRLVNWLLSMSKIGYGVTRQEIPTVVKNLLDRAVQEGYIIPENKCFPDNKLSYNWVYRFMKRHPKLSARTPENFGFRRTYVTEPAIRAWFKVLEEYLLNEHDIDASEFLSQDNASRIFTADESSFPLQGTNHKLQVVSEKRVKNIYRIAPDSKEQITVLSCISTDGHHQRPMVVYPGLREPRYNLTGVNPDDYGVGLSHNGWMTADIFFTWLSSVFFQDIKDRALFPIILFLDGHTSHINLAVSDFCMENNIILYCFPPHASHILQPLNVSVFGPLKRGWNKEIDTFRTKFGVAITRSHFFQLFDPVWKASASQPQNGISGFLSCALVPFNVNRVHFDKCVDPTVGKTHNENSQSTRPESQMNLYERLGARRVLNVIERKLPENLKKYFDKRLEEGYDLEDETLKGVLWSIYKEVTQYVNGNLTLTNQNQVTKHSQPEQNETTEPTNVVHETDIPAQITVEEETGIHIAESCDLAINNTSSGPQVHCVQNADNEHLNQAEPSCSSPRESADSTKTSFYNFEFSPFRKYLVISPNLFSSKKAAKNKSKVPPAVCGKDYRLNLIRIQEKKKKDEQDKQRRKEETERKKAQKLNDLQDRKKNKKRQRLNESTDEEEDGGCNDVSVEYMDSDSIEDEGQLDGICAACLGHDEQEEVRSWIGCNKCPNWFHKSCLHGNIAEMDEEQLKTYNFICPTCTRLQERKRKRLCN